jgi:ribonuclease D
VIDTDQQLAAFLRTLRSAAWVAVDTEADSLHAYPEKLCLIQISTAAGDELVDPLAGINIDPVLDALADHEVVMHAADYDLRMLKRHHAFTPRAIFDTMLASRLLGGRQFGYSHLVEHYLGVTLEKGAQKANWALRPLASRLEAYARNDTRYLRPRPSSVDPDSVWRIKGSQVLNRRALAVLRELWRWREREAIAADRPPFFILSHEVLVAIAAAAAGHNPLETVLPKNISDRWRAGLAKAVAEGLALHEEQLPNVVKRVIDRLSDADQKGVLDLQKLRDARAAELGIDPTLIASRATLTDLARDWEEHAGELMAWQRELMTP